NKKGIFVEEETIVEENESIEFEENEEAMFEENENILEENGEVTLKFYISQSLTTNERRALLFNVGEPFEVSMHDFDHEWWPLVSNIWTRFSYKNHSNGNSWKAFAYRLTKHNYSSGRKDGIPLEKCRKTKTRPPNLCSAKICVLRFVGAQKVQIEQYNNSLDHTHTLEESEVLKRSNAVRKLVEEEAVKNYSPPTIVSAIKDYATKKLDLGTSVKELKRKKVSNIKQKVSEAQKNNRFG
ncbi:8387_t:CDS:1, partial [Gigaspora margarita]